MRQGAVLQLPALRLQLQVRAQSQGAHQSSTRRFAAGAARHRRRPAGDPSSARQGVTRRDLRGRDVRMGAMFSIIFNRISRFS